MSAHGQSQQCLTLSVSEAAALLGVSRSAMYEMIAAGQIPALRLSTRARVPRRAIEQLVEDAMTLRPAEQPWARPVEAPAPAVVGYPRGRKRSGARG